MSRKPQTDWDPRSQPVVDDQITAYDHQQF